MQVVLCIAYFSVLLLLATYGLHRSHLVWTCFRLRKRLAEMRDMPVLPMAEADFPNVTVQLPLYNEATVATRLLEQVAKLDYPHEKLEIQVLDDSTDETGSLARAHVTALRDRGMDITYLHRT